VEVSEPDGEVFCDYCRKGFMPCIDAGVCIETRAMDTVTRAGVFATLTYCSDRCALADAEASADILLHRLYPPAPPMPHIELEPFPEANNTRQRFCHCADHRWPFEGYCPSCGGEWHNTCPGGTNEKCYELVART
jgi:hypothetical protein